MSSTFTVIKPTLPVERRETLIVPDGDRLESVQTLYHQQEQTIDGVCYTLQEYRDALRQLEAEGWQITNATCEPMVKGYDSWTVQLTGVKKLRFPDDGRFEFQVARR